MLDSSPPPVNLDISDDLAASFSDSEPDEAAAVGAAHRTTRSDSAFNGPALRAGTDQRSHVVVSLDDIVDRRRWLVDLQVGARVTV